MATHELTLQVQARIRRLRLLLAAVAIAKRMPDGIARLLITCALRFMRVDYRILPNGKWKPIEISFDWTDI